MSGNVPILAATSRASSMVWAVPESGMSRPIFTIASLKSWRSSPFLIASAFAPIICTPCFFEHARFVERHGGVERGLAAERGQEGVGLFAVDDFLDDLGRDRLDVGAVGELRIGHDRGRVGVDQDDAVALLAQGLAGLDAGVIEFAGLADDDGAGADEEDGFEVGAFGHGRGR